MGSGRLRVSLSAVALCLTACSTGNAAEAGDPPTGLAPPDAIARVLGSLGDTTVRGAEMVTGHDEPLCTSPCLRVSVDTDADHGVKEAWLGELVVGAVGELIRTDETNLGTVIAGEIATTDSNGHVHTAPIAEGGSPVGRQFHSPRDSALRQRVATVAAKHGLGVESVEVLHPLDSALAVTLTVPPGGVPWTIDQLANELMGSPVDMEGLFVELDSPTGKPLIRIARRERFTGGGGWFAPGQDDRFGFNHG
jgi:hypothetical protein